MVLFHRLVQVQWDVTPFKTKAPFISKTADRKNKLTSVSWKELIHADKYFTEKEREREKETQIQPAKYSIELILGP